MWPQPGQNSENKLAKFANRSGSIGKHGRKREPDLKRIRPNQPNLADRLRACEWHESAACERRRVGTMIVKGRLQKKPRTTRTDYRTSGPVPSDSVNFGGGQNSTMVKTSTVLRNPPFPPQLSSTPDPRLVWPIPKSANNCSSWPKMAQIWSNSVSASPRLRPRSAQFRPKPAQFNRSRPKADQSRSNVDRTWGNFSRN